MRAKLEGVSEEMLLEGSDWYFPDEKSGFYHPPMLQNALLMAGLLRCIILSRGQKAYYVYRAVTKLSTVEQNSMYMNPSIMKKAKSVPPTLSVCERRAIQILCPVR